MLSEKNVTAIVNGYEITPRANLRHADLWDANLGSADLRHADLWNANLGRADLSGTNLRHANLRHADLWNANLSGADLSGTNLSGANLRHAIGNGREIKSMQIGEYKVCYTAEILAIGCEQHPIENWETLKNIELEDEDLQLWKQCGDKILKFIKDFPAKEKP